MESSDQGEIGVGVGGRRCETMQLSLLTFIRDKDGVGALGRLGTQSHIRKMIRFKRVFVDFRLNGNLLACCQGKTGSFRYK